MATFDYFASEQTLNRHQRRQEAREETQVLVKYAERSGAPNRKARRYMASRSPRVSRKAAPDLAWLAGLLDTSGRSTIAPVRRQVLLSITGKARLLTALRRRLGGVVEGKRWTQRGREAEATLFAILDRLVIRQDEAVGVLAFKDAERRRGKLSKYEAAILMGRLDTIRTGG